MYFSYISFASKPNSCRNNIHKLLQAGCEATGVFAFFVIVFGFRLDSFSRYETYHCGIAEGFCGGIKCTQGGVSWRPLHLLGVATRTHPCRLSVDLCRIQGATGAAESDDIAQL